MSSLRKRRSLSRLLASSFPGKGLPDAADSRGVAPAVHNQPAGAAEQYESRALTEWWNRMGASTQRRVLDLGTVGAETLQFLNEHGCFLSVLDLATPNASDDADERLAAFTQQLADAGSGDAYGGALCWDLLNFLDDREVRILGQWLSQRLSPGGAVLACVSTRDTLRTQPSIYRIVDQQTLSHRERGKPSTVKGTMTQSRLARLWPEFRIVRSYLLRNGMQEFVLLRQ